MFITSLSEKNVNHHPGPLRYQSNPTLKKVGEYMEYICQKGNHFIFIPFIHIYIYRICKFVDEVIE